MIVTVVKIQLHFPWSNSLKEKRKEIRSIVDKLRAKFKFSVAESDFQNLHRRGEITVAILTHDKKLADSYTSSVVNYLYTITDGEVLSINIDYR